MHSFVYYTPTKVYFGKGEEKKVGEILTGFNPRKVLMVYGSGSIKRIGLYQTVVNSMNEKNIPFVEISGITANPEIKFVHEGIKLGLKEGVDFVLAVGGGSVLDVAKDIAHGIANPEIDPWDYHIGKAKVTKTLRKGAILTLSAAGSEMSNSSVLSDPELKMKRGFGSDFNRFDFAIENPELTYSVSPYQTACGIVDIAMHTIERFFGKSDTSSLTDHLALGLIKNVFDYGKVAMENPSDYDARAELMWSSSIAHNGLTGAGRDFIMQVHQLEHELSALDPEIAHGAGLAALWPSWARYVYPYARERFIKYGKAIWGIEGEDDASIEKAIAMQEEYYHAIGMPNSLEELGIKENDLPYLAERCSMGKTRVMPGYKELGYQEMLDIYSLALRKK